MAVAERHSPTSGYVVAGPTRTYYETRGAGKPVILLHGGLCTAESCEPQASALAGAYGVIVPERRGHGRTADVEGPITYEAMADDTVVFMDALGIASADLVGWSDGALVGLLVALRRPERVRRLVFMGQAATLEGTRPESLAYLSSLTVRTLNPSFERAYAATSPNGVEHFPVVLEKLKRLWCGPTGVSLDELSRVTAPTLVLVGDNDSVSVAHAAAVRDALADGQLGVVPGTSHEMPMEKPEVVNRLILEFLTEEREALRSAGLRLAFGS
ncbi:alpha/beta fold hydrolase [Salinispora oceanensis]|uniref:alpha/beta fold hydrolase n=1 Tax=Salinispora oceanensis TaxID=1050199 RepID=UPI001CC3DC07|nr:alpha/beta hydrolase [Salinispora oceanensis]